MDREKALKFCHKYRDKKFYQPVIFVPGIIEIQGKWHNATKKLANQLLQNIGGKSILDLGCMHGYFLHEAIKCGASKAVGVDYDAVEIAIAREINEIFNNQIELVHMDLDQYIPLQDFDVILMMNVLHVLKNPHETLKKYISSAKEQAIIEYRDGHQKYFPRTPEENYDSFRSVGYRKVALFAFPKNI